MGSGGDAHPTALFVRDELVLAGGPTVHVTTPTVYTMSHIRL